MRSDALLPSPGSSSGRCSSATRASWTRSRRRRGAVGGPVVRPVGERGRRPCSRTTPSCRSTGCRCPGGCPPRPRRWSRPPSTRTRRSAAAPATATGGWPSASPRTARARTGCSTRRPSPAGGCWSCPPGTPRARTRRRCGAVALVVRRLLDRGGAATSASGRPDPVPLTADRIAVGTAHRDQAAAVRAALAGAGRRRGHRGHGEPAPGPGVRRHGGPAPAVGPAGRHGLPSGDGPAVRAGLPAPARVRRGVPGGGRRAAGRAPVDGAGTAGRTVKFPDGWEANHAVLAHLAEHRVRWRP